MKVTQYAQRLCYGQTQKQLEANPNVKHVEWKHTKYLCGQTGKHCIHCGSDWRLPLKVYFPSVFNKLLGWKKQKLI